MLDGLHNLGVDGVALKISHDPKEHTTKRVLTITSTLTPEEAQAVDHMTKRNASWHCDLELEGYQGELIPGGTIAPGKVAEKNPDPAALDPASNRPGDEIERAAQTAKEEAAAARNNGAEPTGTMCPACGKAEMVLMPPPDEHLMACHECGHTIDTREAAPEPPKEKKRRRSRSAEKENAGQPVGA